MDVGLEILGKSDMRLVGGWASVEVVDLEKDYVPVKELAKAMVYYMTNKGGQLFYEHQNKPVGKIIYWDIRKHPDTGKLGVYIIGCIDKGYEFDNAVWEKIKSGELKGFSISGFAKSEEQVIKSEDGKEERVRVLKNIELMEISLVHKPANQYALINEYNMFAKGIRTTDIPDMIKEIINELGDKVDAVTLNKIIDIIASYNRKIGYSSDNGNDDEDEIEVEIMTPVSRQVSKSVKSKDELIRILIGVLDEAKKIHGFVVNHTKSGAYKGMAEDIIKTLAALINEVKSGNIVVNSEKNKSDDIDDDIDKEEFETGNDDDEEEIITVETEGYVNRIAGPRKKNGEVDIDVVKHYVRLNELLIKIEKMLNDK